MVGRYNYHLLFVRCINQLHDALISLFNAHLHLSLTPKQYIFLFLQSNKQSIVNVDKKGKCALNLIISLATCKTFIFIYQFLKSL